MYVGKNTIHHSIFGRKNEFTLSYKLSPPESAHNEYFELYKKIYTDVICAKYKLWNIVKNKVRFMYYEKCPYLQSVMIDPNIPLHEFMIIRNKKEYKYIFNSIDEVLCYVASEPMDYQYYKNILKSYKRQKLSKLPNQKQINKQLFVTPHSDDIFLYNLVFDKLNSLKSNTQTKKEYNVWQLYRTFTSRYLLIHIDKETKRFILKRISHDIWIPINVNYTSF